MRWSLSGVIAVLAALLLALPAQAATETPEASGGFPVALALAVFAGVVTFGYFFTRSWRTTDRND